MEPIKFYIGQESGIVVEKDNFASSIFAEQYKQTFEILDHIMEMQQSQIDDKASTLYPQTSNVIAFCGNRGEGKTSLLTSAKEILSNQDVFTKAKLQLSLEGDYSACKTLNMVDPVLFDTNHNLIELILGQLYNEIDAEIKQNLDGEDRNFAKRKSLLRAFHTAKSCLAYLAIERKEQYDDMAELSVLSASVSLQKAINDLLKEYLAYYNKKKLIISIDDLDLNVEGGYMMAEQIYKYLCYSPYCIVLLALKVNQLESVIMSALRKQLDERVVNEDSISDMARRYVTKLLPLGNRVLMPSGTELAERSIEVIDRDKQSYKYDFVKEAIVQLIYRKTRYIFVNGRSLCPIVPTNLRDLRHLLVELWDLPDFIRDSFEANHDNRSVFKRYFYETWIKCLNKEDQAFVVDLLANNDISSINKQVVRYLSKKLPINVENDNKLASKSLTLLVDIVNPLNSYYNVSYGDVCYTIQQVGISRIDTYTKNLLFFLKSYYSIRLYETYNQVTLSEKHLFPKTEEKQISIYRTDPLLQQQNALQRLVNGSYFTYNPGDNLVSGSNNYARDRRPINAKALWALIKALKQDSTDSQKLNCIEFFLLTTTHPLKKDHGVLEYTWDRTQYDPMYIQQYDETTNYLAFDVLSIFYNMLNIKTTYQKINGIFGDDFYQYALSNKDSLLNKMLSKYPVRNKWKDSELSAKMHGLISDVCIRFSDVQQSIQEMTNTQKYVHKIGGDAENLQWVYKDIKNIGITLYPIDNQQGHLLQFKFLDQIITFLDTKNHDEDDFHEVFNLVLDEPKSISIVERAALRDILSPFYESINHYPIMATQLVDCLKNSMPELFDSLGYEFWVVLFTLRRRYMSWGDIVDRLAPYYLVIKMQDIKIKEAKKLKENAPKTEDETVATPVKRSRKPKADNSKKE